MWPVFASRTSRRCSYSAMFSRDGLMRDLANAGFFGARIADEPCLAFGIHWPEPWSVPIVAKKPA